MLRIHRSCSMLLLALGAAACALTSPETVKVAAVQCSSRLGDSRLNSEKLTALVREAAANGAKIVVLPEASITGYLSQDL
ncbi:MAG: nitrilase-related carbon-nitrogen hydrolase, partial [Planctomycetota bacterium]